MTMKRSCRTGEWARLARALLGVAACGSSSGCYDFNCDQDYLCPSLGDEEPSCPADPAEAAGNPVPARCGVWVSSSLGDDAHKGSPNAPVATLDEALRKALDGPRRVFACSEKFEGPVEWPAGVSLHGGFECADLQWRYLHGVDKTTLTAPADLIPLTLTGSALPEPSMLTDLVVQAQAAGVPGGSSIAVLALADARAEIRRSKLWADNGADGADGDSGDHLGFPAKDGLHGKDGGGACTSAVGEGGALVALDCGDDASFGGEGGDGGVQAATSGDDGEVAPAMSAPDLGLGGQGEDLLAGTSCTKGVPGGAGIEGETGLGAAWPPRLTASGYVGVGGADGKRGRAGQGGGGGGASAGTAACGAGFPHGGAGGGSGGSGGCGGRGGRGGQPGGSSIALATLTGELMLVEVYFATGNGGRGGAGGMPQQGGQGGLPGIGGLGLRTPGGPNAGCIGGVGGRGGDGGPAGGGLGGSTFSLAYAGTAPPSLVSFGHQKGKAGEGGPGSDADNSLTSGAAGRSSEIEPLLP